MKFNIDFPDRVREDLEWVRKELGVTSLTHVILTFCRLGIALVRANMDGGKFIVKYPDGREVEILFGISF